MKNNVIKKESNIAVENQLKDIPVEEYPVDVFEDKEPQLELLPSIKTMDEAISEFSSKHSLCFYGSDLVVMEEDLTPKNQFGKSFKTFEFKDLPSLKQFYANQKYVFDGKLKDVVTLWQESPNHIRKSYEKVVFAPGETVPSNTLNLFRGFAYDPIQGDWSLFKDHIENIICNGVQEHYEYLLDWMADLILNPQRKSGVSVCVKGKKGTGKSLFAEIFGALLGTNYMAVTDRQEILGNFNSHLEECLLLYCDEAVWAGDKPSEGKLKALITEQNINIERKFCSKRTARSYLRLLFTSNENWVVPAGVDERRFFCLETNSSKAKDTSYFSAMINQMMNGGFEAMMFDLLQRKPTRESLSKIPQTAALMDQKLAGLNSLGKWYYSVLQSGELSLNWVNNPVFIPSNTLQDLYIEFAKKSGDKRPLIGKDFVNGLKAFYPNAPENKFPGLGRLHKVQSRGYHFPTLGEAREEFQTVLGAPLAWDEVVSSEANTDF